MSDLRLDPDGRIQLSEDLRRRLGWQSESELTAQVDGDRLLLQPATRAAGLKEEARRLASAMRDLASSVAGEVARKASTLAEPTAAAPADGPKGAAFQGVSPRIPASVYLAPGSQVIGDVVLGEETSLWPGAVARGDVAPVRVGARCNIQENAVLHVSPQAPCTLGEGVTVGHHACVHACTVGDYTLVGIHAVVLDGCRIGRRCLIGAGAVLSPGTEIPDGKLVLGVPGKVVRDLTPAELERLQWSADAYVRLREQYLHPTPVAEPSLPAGPPAVPAPPTRDAVPRRGCPRARGEIRPDGSLDDPGWEQVPILGHLVLAESGETPRLPTEVRACWDDRYLYVAFSCKDTDVWANFAERDDPLHEEEVVEVFLCPTGDLKHYYEIEVSPANVIFDAKIFNPEGRRATLLVDPSWNAPGLTTGVRVTGSLNDRTTGDLGWIAELAIPFADLGLPGPPEPGTVWRANFLRIERGEHTEFSAWSPTYLDPADFHLPARFGELVFEEG